MMRDLIGRVKRLEAATGANKAIPPQVFYMDCRPGDFIEIDFPDKELAECLKYNGISPVKGEITYLPCCDCDNKDCSRAEQW